MSRSGDDGNGGAGGAGRGGGAYVAADRAAELPANPDFRVLVTVGFDKVTDQVLAQARGKTGRAYFDAVDAASKQIVAECEKDGSVRCSVANMYYGTDFYRIRQLELVKEREAHARRDDDLGHEL